MGFQQAYADDTVSTSHTGGALNRNIAIHHNKVLYKKSHEHAEEKKWKPSESQPAR